MKLDTRLVIIPILITLILCMGVGEAFAQSQTNEPPMNPYLDSPYWSTTHGNPYAQSSSIYPGLTSDDVIEHNHNFVVPVTGIPITLCVSSEYGYEGSAERVIWGAEVGFDPTIIYKLDAESLDLIDAYTVPFREFGRWIRDREASFLPSESGAYNILDNEGNFFVTIRKEKVLGIEAYGDKNPGQKYSPIEKRGRFEIPEEKIHKPDEANLVGIKLTYDGKIVFCTNTGTVGIVSRDLSENSAQYIQLNDNHELTSNEEETVSNSFAVDEDGGIYIVSSEKMYRIQWTGQELSLDPKDGAWSADYQTGEGVQAGRLGEGAGSTPTLMGVDNQDKFVVITDGQKLMNIVLFWRDEIPENWEPIEEGKDIRIAAENPVTFGKNIDESTSEQSVCVRGYGAVVVNNKQGTNFEMFPGEAGRLTRIFDGFPSIAPKGIQKFEWDPEERELKESWANPDISMPNGIPAMSAETNLIYDIGQRDGIWTLEAVDWNTGESAFHYDLDCMLWHNSFYAGMEIGPDKNLYIGGLGGVMQFKPENS